MFSYDSKAFSLLVSGRRCKLIDRSGSIKTQKDHPVAYPFCLVSRFFGQEISFNKLESPLPFAQYKGREFDFQNSPFLT